MVQAWDRFKNFLGVGYTDETDSYSIKHRNAWLERRKRLLSRRCGHLVCDQHQQSNTVKTTEQCDLPQQDRQQRQFDATCNPNTVSESSELATINIDNDNARNDASTNIDIVAEKSQHQQQPPKDNYPFTSSTDDQIDFDARESVIKLVNDILSRHEPKRVFGLGFVGNLLKRKFKKDLTYDQLNALYSFNDHRPYFTYWVTTVQILIMIITLFTYGRGPFGFSETLIEKKVFVPSLNYHQESYYEKDNIWLGPRASDLIHLGAKFTPCMRRDLLIYEKIILSDRNEEKFTGCCVRPDQSGCLQTTRDTCSSKWLSWNASTTSDPAPFISATGMPRTSGPVCGQDPDYCSQPASRYPHEWKDDISQWPICNEPLPITKPLHHMSCKLVGRPCCIGIYGQCRITTSQHCQFLRGTFHPEATLCSQVSCMEDVCGMVPFYARDFPDQFYRLATALFLHAGLIHLTLTVALQYYVMRDIERLLGSKRMALIYIIPGIVGYIASATFVPYHTQVGPSGSQFALLACLIAETINSWSYLEDPFNSLMKFIAIAASLFVLGLLPWIDNYAHIFGFITGLALALALTPYLTPLTEYSRRLKVIQVVVCVMFVIILIIMLTLALYIYPLYECSWCKYLDCLPIYPDWCKDQDINVTKLDIF